MSQTPDRVKPRILVIEDNPADVELLRWALEKADVDCDLIVIADGGEALAFITRTGENTESVMPALAIVDLNLPKYDGIELLEAMRATPALSNLPVAVLSSSSSPRDRAKMEVFGVGRYITKPPDLDEYMQIGFVVKELLEKSRSAGSHG